MRRLLLTTCLAAVLPAMPLWAAGVDLPALQITTPSGESSILLETMHQGDARVPLPSRAIVEQAVRVILESDIGARPLPRHTQGPPADSSQRITMDSILDEREKTSLRARVRCRLPADSSPAEIEAITALAFTGPLRVTADFTALCPTHGQPSVERWLVEAASTRRVPLDGLEGVMDSTVQRSSLPDTIFVSGVHRVLAEGEEIFSRLTAYINAGNYEGVCNLARESFASPSDAALFERRMVTERNALWMPLLEQYLEDGQAVIAVGAAHLCGVNGLPALLTSKGYQVESIRIPAVANLSVP